MIERTFDLLNSDGVAYTLTYVDRYTGFMYGVSGLGTEHKSTYQKIGEEYDLIKDEINQGKINGSIFFMSAYPYQEYLRFADFCQDKSLRLHYRTPAGDFYRDGRISKIEKNENGGAMKVKIEFICTSLWYKELHNTAVGTTIDIISESSKESPCHISFTPGKAITALSWNHSVDNTLILTGSITNIRVSNAQTVHIRTDTNPYKIYRNTEATDYYKNSDFTTGRFVLLEKGVNSISFSVSGNISIEGRELYETV